MPSTKPGHAGGDRPRASLRISKRGGVNDPPPVKKKPETPPAERPSLLMVHNGDHQYVGTVVLFPEGSNDLSDEGRERLKRLAYELRGLPHKIEIRGHATRCPSSPGGPPQDAWELSYQRCLATMKFLEQQGIDQTRMRLSQGGPFEPYSLSTDAQKLAYNSRVEVQMLGEYAEDSMGTPEERASRFIGPK
jgi:chemotaxis protein MotB